MRRNLKQDQEPLNKAQLLKLLWPDHSARADQIMAIRQKEIEREFAKGSAGGEGESMQRFFDMAMMFKVLDQEAKRSKSLIEEEKKQEEAKVESQSSKKDDGEQKTNIYGIAEEAVL